MRMIGRRLRIFGTVQGVFFRAWTVQQAQMLGVKGWVRNRRDGSVEAEAWGDAAPVERLIALCGQGPSQARVDRVAVEEIEGEAPAGFRAAPTL
jgi:acylphosphatase